MVHKTYNPSLIDICQLDKTLRKSKQSKFNYNRPKFIVDKLIIEAKNPSL